MSEFYILVKSTNSDGTLLTDFFELTTTSEITYNLSGTVESSPVAIGNRISDHFSMNNRTVNFKGLVSEIKSYRKFGEVPRQKTVKEYLEGLEKVMRSGSPVTVFFDSRVDPISNSVITNLNFNRSSSTGTAYNVSIDFESVQIAERGQYTETKFSRPQFRNIPFSYPSYYAAYEKLNPGTQISEEVKERIRKDLATRGSLFYDLSDEIIRNSTLYVQFERDQQLAQDAFDEQNKRKADEIGRSLTLWGRFGTFTQETWVSLKKSNQDNPSFSFVPRILPRATEQEFADIEARRRLLDSAAADRLNEDERKTIPGSI